MKQFIPLICVCLLFLNLIGCNNSKSKQAPTSVSTLPAEGSDASAVEARLIVNGRDITEDNYVRINHTLKNAEIPVLAVFRELGYDVKVESNGHVILDNDYVLLETLQPDFGHPMGYEGEGAVRKKLDGEFVIDYWSVCGWWYWGLNIDVEIDYDANTIYVNSFDPDTYQIHNLQLLVNGKDITEGNEAYLRKYYKSNELELPVLAIMKALGAEVIWTDSGIITVKFDGKEIEYDLNLTDFGCMPAPGGVVIRKTTDTEIYMDWYATRTDLLYLMEADIRTDYDQYIVYVDFIDTE